MVSDQHRKTQLLRGHRYVEIFLNIPTNSKYMYLIEGAAMCIQMLYIS